MAWNGNASSVRRIFVDRMPLALANEHAAVSLNVPQKVTAFHDTATPTFIANCGPV